MTTKTLLAIMLMFASLLPLHHRYGDISFLEPFSLILNAEVFKGEINSCEKLYVTLGSRTNTKKRYSNKHELYRPIAINVNGVQSKGSPILGSEWCKKIIGNRVLVIVGKNQESGRILMYTQLFWVLTHFFTLVGIFLFSFLKNTSLFIFKGYLILTTLFFTYDFIIFRWL